MLINIVLALFVAWLVIITFIVVSTRKHYEGLVNHAGKRDLGRILDELLKEVKQGQNGLHHLEKEVALLRDKSVKGLSRVGVVRFNPFSQTEGEKSCVIALVNEQRSGLIMNFIYVPDGIRVYTKHIEQGKARGVDLTDEEKNAIDQAC